MITAGGAPHEKSSLMDPYVLLSLADLAFFLKEPPGRVSRAFPGHEALGKCRREQFRSHRESDRPCTLVSKKENLRIPIISSWMKTMEMIAFDRSDLRASLQMVKDVAEVLKNGRPVIIYPEGTRSKSSVMGEFKPGALKPAFLAKVPVVPVTMKNSYIIDVDDDDDSHIEIIYDKPIEYEEYKDMNTTELAEKVQGIIQKHLDEK